MERPVQHIQLRDAKAQLSAVVAAAEHGQASVITKHGEPAAVVISYAEWQRLSKVPSFGWLLMNSPLEEGDIPERDQTPLRDIDL